MPTDPSHRSDQLLDAATRCFTRRGFHATTVQDIATEADVSAGLLYRYFDGKEALVVALVERYIGGVRTAVEEAPTLDAALEALFDDGTPAENERAEGALFVEVMAEALRNERVAAVVRRADRQVAEAVAARLRTAQRAGGVTRDLDADATAELILALGDGLTLRVALDDDPSPDDRAALDATLVTLLTRLLEPSR